MLDGKDNSCSLLSLIRALCLTVLSLLIPNSYDAVPTIISFCRRTYQSSDDLAGPKSHSQGATEPMSEAGDPPSAAVPAPLKTLKGPTGKINPGTTPDDIWLYFLSCLCIAF